MEPKHHIFNELLKNHVDENGNTNYRGFLDNKVKLEEYLESLKLSKLSELNKISEKLSFWINAYNALTIYQVILLAEKKGKVPKSYYKFGFLSAIHKIYEDKSFLIAGMHVTLSEIENKILRGQFEEPRIHSALNCATGSCPIIRKEAYLPEKLNNQLEEATHKFVNSDNGVKIIKPGHLEVSKIILSWYKNDFKNKFGSVLDFLKKYAQGIKLEELNKLKNDNELKVMKYDWKINS